MTDPVDERRPPDGHDDIRAILNALPAMVGYWDRDLRNRMANDAYLEYFGRTPQEMRGIHISEVLGPDLYERNHQYMVRALAGEPQLFDREIPMPSGEVRFTQASYIPDEVDGDVRGFFVLVTDITERKRAEVALTLESQITENMAEGALLIRASGLDIVHANAAAERLFAYDAGELVGLPLSALDAPVVGQDPSEIADAVRDAVTRGDGTWSGEILSARKDGSTFWRESTTSAFEHPDHGTLLVSVFEDVTSQREHAAEEQALSSIATLVAEGAGPTEVFSAVADHLAGLFDAQAAFVTRFDIAAVRGSVVGDSTPGADLDRTVDLEAHGASAEVCRTGLAARAEVGGSAEIAAPVVVDGTLWGTVGAAFTGRLVPAGTERRLARFARLVALAISNAEAWDKLSRQASTDALTGLANHRTFHERLRAELERARRYGRELSLVMIDIDRFKSVNDAHGHQVGDQVLAEIARRIATQAREGEVVARIGGEEFAWLMPETSARGAFAAADRVREAIAAQPIPVVGTVTVSAGICSTEHSGNADELVRNADRALYWAKENGRNRSVIYSEQAGAVAS